LFRESRGPHELRFLKRAALIADLRRCRNAVTSDNPVPYAAARTL
jgi:hypothetical protein